MKKRIVLALVLGVLNLQGGGLSKLEALSMLETGDNDWAMGNAGEVSRYQLMPRIWRHYTESESYTDPAFASQIAAQHLAALEKVFRTKTGREPSDFDRYVLWNAGETYYARIKHDPQRVHPVIRERANRYVNLRQLSIEPKASLLAANEKPKDD